MTLLPQYLFIESYIEVHILIRRDIWHLLYDCLGASPQRGVNVNSPGCQPGVRWLGPAEPQRGSTKTLEIDMNLFRIYDRIDMRILANV